VEGLSLAALEAFSTDFTELDYDGGNKKVHLMVMLDIQSEWAGGWSVGAKRNHSMALEAIDSPREGLALLGHASLSEVIVHHDKDSVYASYRWLGRLLLEVGVRVSYAQRGARDNPWIESFWGRFGLRHKPNFCLPTYAHAMAELGGNAALVVVLAACVKRRGCPRRT
jgi:putative transposase